MKRRKTKTKKSHFPAFYVGACAAVLSVHALTATATYTMTFDKPEPAQAQVIETPDVSEGIETPREPAQTISAPRISSSLPSKDQKDTTVHVCARVYEGRQEIIAAAGISEGIFMTSCYYDMLAMAYAESRFNCSAIGDQGRSRGCFQIQTAMHKVTVEQAESFAWAMEWTLDRMVRDLSYPRYRTAAIRRHNGAGDAAAMYAESVKSTAASFEARGL